MATVADLTVTPLSGLNHIDALLDKGPDWNYLTSNGGENVLYYTFSVSAGTEPGRSGQTAFTADQQEGARMAMAYLSQVTGIEFRETQDGANAQLHLSNLVIPYANTTGMCSWSASNTYNPLNNQLSSYTANAWVYLDSGNFGGQNGQLRPGTAGYETLLHELGHAMGLKHPFLEGAVGDVVLPKDQDHTGNTLMSYTHKHGGPAHSTYSPYDIAALNWLYGGDGLRGALGINSTGGRFLTGTERADTLVGTAFDDLFHGMGGNDMIYGGQGFDKAVFAGQRGSYQLQAMGDGSLAVTGASGTTVVRDIEALQFDDASLLMSDLTDLLAPARPVLAVAQNAHQYSLGNRPTMSGSAEAGATVRVYVGEQLVATAVADANGLWSARSTVVLADGLGYSAHAIAVDAAGNVSAPSEPSTFHVDATPPLKPTANHTLAEGSNQPVFSGTGEAGTVIHLYRTSDWITIGEAEVGADGTWTFAAPPLPNGEWEIAVAATDLADNASSADARLAFAIDNPLSVNGTAGADTLIMAPGSAAIDGGAGLDVAVYAGNRADFTLERGLFGFSVRSANGDIDNLINVERIKFDDTMVALDIDGTAGQLYRLYQAAFDRVPDAAGLAFWINAMDTGLYTLSQITEYVMANPEFTGIYDVTTDAEFVNLLYRHVLHREGDGPGFDWWVENLPKASRTEVLVSFSESAENQAQVIAAIEDGIAYPFG